MNSSLFVRDSVAVITLDAVASAAQDEAPAHRALRLLKTAQSEPALRGIVLVGDAETFGPTLSSGSMTSQDTRELLAVQAMIDRIDDSALPVVASIEGDASGAGLALALACHARVALETATVSFPETSLGLVPALGATQRLPRLIGIALAAEMILDGQPRRAASLADSRLFNKIVTDHTTDAAVQWANDLASSASSPPRARDQSVDPDKLSATILKQTASLSARQKLQPAYPAAISALSSVDASFEAGLEAEASLLVSLRGSTAARALGYQARSEREAVSLPAALSASPRAMNTVAVIGAGTMGSGIGISALDAGLTVLLLEQDQAAAERGRARIDDYYRGRVTSGKLKAARAGANMARLEVTTEWSRLSVADIVIEAVFEDMAVKRDVFAKIDRHAKAGAVLATNTSYLDVDAIAAATKRPGDVLGLHFFSPANVMRLLEVVRGVHTFADVLATGMKLGTTLGKMPVMCGNAFGFIGNRIYNAYRRECEFMLEDGAWPEDVDAALTSMGFAMGPFAVADLSGLDIAWRMRKSQSAKRDPRERYVSILDHLCELGRLGRKSSVGYYVYTNGKPARSTDQVVRDIVLRASSTRGIVRRPIEASEIQRRAMLAMVNEAALLLAEGVASRASDIDVVMVQGYGFPRWEGGPVFWARQQQRATLEHDMKELAAAAGHGFALADLEALLAT